MVKVTSLTLYGCTAGAKANNADEWLSEELVTVERLEMEVRRHSYRNVKAIAKFARHAREAHDVAELRISAAVGAMCAKNTNSTASCL